MAKAGSAVVIWGNLIRSFQFQCVGPKFPPTTTCGKNYNIWISFKILEFVCFIGRNAASIVLFVFFVSFYRFSAIFRGWFLIFIYYTAFKKNAKSLEAKRRPIECCRKAF